ncbi:MAG: prolipoprotein diacylglyceryl transferase, partial [Anaerolineales bacterium]
GMMKKKIDKANIPSLQELQEVAQLEGVNPTVLALCLGTATSFAMLLDAAAPGVALAQAIGRWGNFVNQELYGQPTDVPWCIKIDPAHRLPGYGEFDCFHPLFLYESIWNLLNMFFLLWLFRKYRKNLINGDLFLVYMITYPIGRFLLEYLRLDYVQIAGINFNQALMLVVAILVASFLVIRHRRKPKTT